MKTLRERSDEITNDPNRFLPILLVHLIMALNKEFFNDKLKVEYKENIGTIIDKEIVDCNNYMEVLEQKYRIIELKKLKKKIDKI